MASEMWGHQPSLYHKAQENIAQKLCHVLDGYSDLLLLTGSWETMLRLECRPDTEMLCFWSMVRDGLSACLRTLFSSPNQG